MSRLGVLISGLGVKSTIGGIIAENMGFDCADNSKVLSFWHGGIRVRNYGALHIQRRKAAGKRDDACGDDSCHGNPGGGFRGDSAADTRDSEQLGFEARDG